MRLARYLAAGALVLCCQGHAAASRDAAPAQIWPRLIGNLRLVNDDLPDTIHWARHYARHPQAFNDMMARARPYLWLIVDEVERRDMPSELALLPAVESGFEPAARSNQHAQGLWQFVPWTSRELGLQIDRQYDARRDAEASTRVALDYLANLHDRYENWYLALAAYNMGANRLSALMAQQGTRDFWSLKLPRETREHVRRLLGMALLVEQPRRFSVRLPAISAQPDMALVALDKPVDLQRVAARAQVSTGTIRTYNAGLYNLRNTTGKKTLLLPQRDAIRLRQALEQHVDPPVPVPTFIIHVVKRGDSLWGIAHRYQVHVRDLARHNSLSPHAVLRPGRRIEVPIES